MSGKRKLTYSNPTDPIIKRFIISTIEYATGRGKLEKILNEIMDNNPLPEELWSIMREKLELKVSLNQNKLSNIPKNGPLIFIANHPFGVIDGIIFGEIINSIRPKFKFLVNEALCKEEKLDQYFLPIDFRENKEAILTNLTTKKNAIEYLEQGNTIAIFPAGGVSTAPNIWQKATDLEWKKFLWKLIRKAKANVVPIYFNGTNSFAFQLLSIVSMDLRVSLLMNEVRNKIGSTIEVKIGNVIDYDQIKEVSKDEDILTYLRNSVYDLK